MAKLLKRLKFFLCLAVLIPAIIVIGFQISKSRTFQFFGEIVPRIDTGQKVVALTFDDGPTPAGTEQIISVLDDAGVKATFFLTGAELEQNPELGKKLVAARHEIGNHSFSHSRMILKTLSFVATEIERTDRLIRQTGYQGPIHFRPPFGKKLFVLPWYLSQHSRKSITWDIEPDSYPEIASEAEKIVRHVIEKVRPGSIILLHVMYPNRIESLKSVKGIIAGLKDRGYQFKTVSELIASTN